MKTNTKLSSLFAIAVATCGLLKAYSNKVVVSEKGQHCWNEKIFSKNTNWHIDSSFGFQTSDLDFFAPTLNSFLIKGWMDRNGSEGTILGAPSDSPLFNDGAYESPSVQNPVEIR